ncbi:hypothetical protein E2562_032762 [Oryza meyeriana var. granulata]|uniref:Uncharacterized protein n=1 Tax=Oryza meyeriana var. granulata TaxID=110450 RepID=A0A6G1F0M1_9ORYZ|nr:hypothetical protein E2562_032762 [Oryza meyeriana var. granulata]
METPGERMCWVLMAVPGEEVRGVSLVILGRGETGGVHTSVSCGGCRWAHTAATHGEGKLLPHGTMR